MKTDVKTENSTDGSLSACATYTWFGLVAEGGTPDNHSNLPEPIDTDDLSWRQRVGAGVGPGVTGGLLFMFFAWPRRKTNSTKEQYVPERISRKECREGVIGGKVHRDDQLMDG
ncbi:uncharacterized protein B0J16DRAFT_321733 [Fusarium flagelliforme]|uniref:uncharacterized protein n=1 Tax=Fusarium flagelliforme TaxID=2675880 RepID=UPI001E8E5E1D|nr:uncharacterized protein B0J16DRAFT_321733 [Fusarium flagelliforme]KAH7182976.1 hypothetical protein B0J16DRAFT_321733 [Fusarium flagelliforme]